MFTDGTARRSLTGSSDEARCFWRPRSRYVAVLSGGWLRLYRDPMERGVKAGTPVPGTQTRKRVRVLRDLFRDGLIDKAEYNERFMKMMGYY